MIPARKGTRETSRAFVYTCFDILVLLSCFRVSLHTLNFYTVDLIFSLKQLNFKMGRGLDASTNLGKALLVSSGFGIVLALIGIIGELETDFYLRF